jgi:hypothetical protein
MARKNPVESARERKAEGESAAEASKEKGKDAADKKMPAFLKKGKK